MTLTPLADLGFRWRDHRSTLWWLALLYRRPAQFEEASREFSRREATLAAAKLWWHFLPYFLVLCVLGRVVLFGFLGLPAEQELTSGWEMLGFHAFGIAGGIAFGIAFGIGVGIAFGIAGGIAFGIAGGIGVGIAGGIAFGIAVGIGAGVALPRAYYVLPHLLFLWPRPRARWYPYHPVAWDDLCGIPFFGFDRLLVAYTEAFPVDGTAEIERLISTYPAQRMAALRARTTLLARQAATVAHLSLLDSIVAQLPGGNKDFLPETSQVRELVREIAQLQRHLDAITRPIFRAPTARLLCAEIENFSHKIGGFDQPLASEFRAAASQWLLLARRQFQEVQAASEREPSPQVFRAGDPVNRENEAFVRRESVFGELEKQVMLSTGCPGIVLYGRRRMGKTTILRNVRGLLPTTVVPVFVSMQNAQAFTSLDHFLHHLTTAISEAWPGHPVPPLRSSDLPAFMQCLADWNTHCLATGKRLLLAVDEYETLDEKIGTGVLSLDLLATLRESIQSHRQLTWAFAGSHEITELSHAPWTSYLVSARTIEVPLFTLEETRLLLTEPLQYSSLWQDRTTERPRFPVEFWGEGGIERIHYEAGGWPHLVQLIAETAINLLNDEKSVRSLNAALLERTCNAAVGYGTNVLTQLLRDESTLPGEWEYLAAFRTCATQPPPSDNALQRSLPRRLLVENADNGEWRLRVPLMARWLRERG